MVVKMGKLIAEVPDELLRSIERGDVTIEEETGSEALLSNLQRARECASCQGSGPRGLRRREVVFSCREGMLLTRQT
jgi:hypothetical protein